MESNDLHEERKMKKLLLATVGLAALALPASADSITATITDNGSLVNSTNSGTGSLDIPSVTFGTFQVNTVTADSHSILGGNSILDTNTIDIKNLSPDAITHQLVIDIVDTGITGFTGLQNFLSEFSVTNLTAGWTTQLQTFVNSNPLSDTGVLNAETTGIDMNAFASATNPLYAEVRYTINDVGGITGEFNGGIDISVAAVPGPVVGAGLPGFVAMLAFGGWMWRRRLMA
jgi:hypothetical protein